MIGVYDYTVILTYLSMASGCIGIIVTMTGIGHPHAGVFFLMISGILDAFDGKVARTKKNRTDIEMNFGVQIDSLADLICFGVLPTTIGMAMLRVSGIFTELVTSKSYEGSFFFLVLLIMIAVFYILAALIRLAYFNATVEMREKEAKETGVVHYVGMPVTTAALIFPLILMIHRFTRFDLTVLYFIVMLIVAFLFLANVKVRKPGKKGLTIIILIGLIEFAASIAVFYLP